MNLLSSPEQCARCIVEVAARTAARFAFSPEKARDFAVGFFAHVWRDGRCILAAQSAPAGRCSFPRQLVRCACHYAIDQLRAISTMRSHEAPWPADPKGTAWEPPDSVLDPAAVYLRTEALSALLAAVNHLTDRQRDILARFYGRGESSATIAAALGMSDHSVRQALYSARNRLRRLLEASGHSAEDLLFPFASGSRVADPQDLTGLLARESETTP